MKFLIVIDRTLFVYYEDFFRDRSPVAGLFEDISEQYSCQVSTKITKFPNYDLDIRINSI